MSKLSSIGVAIVVVVMAIGGGAWSYMRTAWNHGLSTIKSQIPIEFELKRAHDHVEDLIPEARTYVRLIATEEIDIEQLGEKIAAKTKKLADDERDILRVQSDLGKNNELNEVFVYGGKQYTRQQVKQDLARKFERYKVDDADLASLAKSKLMRESNLHTAQQKLQSMVAEKETLEGKVEELEGIVRRQQVEVATNALSLDKTKLTRARNLIDEIRKRLAVTDRVLKAEASYFGEISVDALQTDTIVEDVAKYFAGNKERAHVADAR